MERTDSELLERWRAGDLASGETLFERYYGSVERFFLNKVSVGVGDLVQETFTACVESRDRVSDGRRFRAYLFGVAYNLLCAYLRRHYRKGHEFSVDEISVHDVSPSPSSVAIRRREQRLLLEALRNIPITYQVILELHYWEEMTTADIAEVLSLPVGTVRSRMRRGRELLHVAMDRLAASREILESTRTKLDDWAAQCRRELMPVSIER